MPLGPWVIGTGKEGEEECQLSGWLSGWLAGSRESSERRRRASVLDRDLFLLRRWETSTSSFPPLLVSFLFPLLFFLSRRRLCLFIPELSPPPETGIPGFCGGFSRGDTIL